MNRKNGKRKPRKHNRGGKGNGARWRGPRPYVVGRVVNMHIRYYAIAAETDTITGKNLLNCLSMAATTTTSYRFFAALKIKRFDLWAGGAISSVAVVQPGISLEWYQVAGTAFTNSVKISDNAGGANKPAFLTCRPPKDSSQSFWISSGGALDTTDTIIAISVGVGAIIDFYFKACIVDDDTVFGAEAPTGATVGKVYYDFLDGLASGNLSPVSVNVIPSPWGPGQNIDVGGFLSYPEDVQIKLRKLYKKAFQTGDMSVLDKAVAIAKEASDAMHISSVVRGYIPKSQSWADMAEESEVFSKE